MSQIRASQFQKQIVNPKVSDGKIDSQELAQLNVQIQRADVSPNEKKMFMMLAKKINQATTNGFFKSEKVTANEMKSIEALASQLKGSKLVDQLMADFKSNQAAATPTESASQTQAAPSTTKSGGGLGAAIARFFQNLFGGGNKTTTTTSQSSVRSVPQHNSSPVDSRASFGTPRRSGTSQGTARRQTSSQPSPVRQAGGVGPLRTNGAIPSWMVSQNGTGLPSAGGDCGPATAAMVARRFGFNTNANSREAVQTARQHAGVTRSRNGGAWAISEAEVTKSIQGMTGGAVRQTSSTGLIRSNSSGAANRVRQALSESLSRGDMPILLTGSPSSSSRHYMVVTEVKPNGNLVMADPAGGKVWEMTPQKLEQLMRKADRRGGTNVMSYNN